MMKCWSACFIASIAPLAAAVFAAVAMGDGKLEDSSRNDFVKLATGAQGVIYAQEKAEAPGVDFGATRAAGLSLQHSAEARFESIQVANEASTEWVSVSINEQAHAASSFASVQLQVIGVADVIESSADREYAAGDNMLPAVFVFSDELELNKRSRADERTSAASQRHRF